MRAPRPSGFCSSCPQPDPPLHRAVLQRISIQNTILVHHPAATVHQHNPALQSPFTLADNSQPYPGQPHFLTGTHIVMKAASCKIASRHPQTVKSPMKNGRWNACLTLRDYIRSNLKTGKKFTSIVVLYRDWRAGSSSPQPPCYLTLPNRKFNS